MTKTARKTWVERSRADRWRFPLLPTCSSSLHLACHISFVVDTSGCHFSKRWL